MYSTITFTTGDKSLVMSIGSILGQAYRPSEIILVHDKKWGNEIPREIWRYANICNHEGITLKYIGYDGKNFAEMKNFGYAHINNQYVLYVEDDAWIPSNYSLVLLGQLHDKGVGAIGGCQLIDQQHQDLETAQEWDRKRLPNLPLYQRMKIVDNLLEYDGVKHQLYRYTESKVIPAMTLIHTYMMKTDIFKSVGGWDEKAPESGSLMYEEVDVFLKMFAEKINVLIHTGIQMWHIREISSRRVGDKIDLEKRVEARKIRKEYFGRKYKGII